VSDSHIKHAVCVQDESKGQTFLPLKSVTEMVLSRHCRMTKAIKQAQNYLLTVHFDTRSSRTARILIVEATF
jgi:hypothetical protein